MTNKDTQSHTQAKKSDLTSSVLERIETEKIEPTSRWYFVFSECTIWSLWLVSVIIGAVSVAVMLYVSVHAGYALYEATHNSFLEFFIEVIPFLWVTTLLVMAAVAYFNLRHTKKGYRYPVWQILISSLFLSILGGGILHSLGAGQIIETAMEKTMPMYPTFEEMEKKWWQKPDAGLLVGQFIEFNEDESLATFVDTQAMSWQIKTDELKDFEIELLSSGKLVRIMGIQATSTPDLFYGCMVSPWMHGKPVRLDDMRKDRREFITRVDDLKKRIENRFEQAELQFIGTSTRAEELEPMGMCPTMPLIQKMP